MAQKKVHLKYKNIAIALAVVLLLILSLVTACSDNGSNEDSSSLIDSSSVDDTKLTNNYKYVSIKNEENINKGLLLLVNDDHPYKADDSVELEGIYDYLFEGDEQIMQASGTGVKGNTLLLTALNAMVKDFYKETKLDNIVVNSIYSDNSADDDKEVTVDSPEHATGYAMDLNTYNDENGSYPKFEATGKYAWIGENCWKYGFIQRYTEDKEAKTGVKALSNHFRYVGQIHAEIMTKNGLCLEEYLDYIKGYSFEKPLEFACENGSEFVLYYVAAGKDKTTNLPIPLDKNDQEYKYGYSSNNTEGYIVWVQTVEETIVEAPVADSEAEDSGEADSSDESGVSSLSTDEISSAVEGSSLADETSSEKSE